MLPFGPQQPNGNKAGQEVGDKDIAHAQIGGIDIAQGRIGMKFEPCRTKENEKEVKADINHNVHRFKTGKPQGLVLFAQEAERQRRQYVGHQNQGKPQHIISRVCIAQGCADAVFEQKGQEKERGTGKNQRP